MATNRLSWLDDAFRSAKEEFKRNLSNPALCDFSKISSINDVLEEANRIQRQQAKTKTLRALGRIRPFIDGLKEYASIIEVFAQAKPEIMSLLWGPLKFILQASSSVISAFDKVVKVLADLGMTLPSFKEYAQLFSEKFEIRRALCLFYEDILDFYSVLLNFLANRRLNIFLESLWPKIRSSISKVQENIESHKAMMMVNVTLQDIVQAHRARKDALEEYEAAQAAREEHTYNAIHNKLNPRDYDMELASILRRSSVDSGKWLEDEPDFMRWLNTMDRTTRCVWLHGIPGSGKTFLVGNLIRRLRANGQGVLFAFLSHDNQSDGDTVKVFHSFLFQVLEDNAGCRPVLNEASQTNSRKLKSDSDFVMDLLCNVLHGLGPMFIVLDGLDELNESSWKHLLLGIMQINDRCPETKLLISSREEREIALRLGDKALPLRIDHNNSEDIEAFVQLERMFIYARLVLSMVEDQGTLQDIEAQIEDLPDGLNEVYGRLLVRIKETIGRSLQAVVRTILQWITCAQRPLREEEMLQILAIEPGQLDFTKGRKVFRDIRKACGPIIEIDDGVVRFVHFSAREYLLHEQSANFLDLYEAHAYAALTCITYLSFSSLDPLFSSSLDAVEDQIINGDYVLFEYASAMFLDHLKISLENEEKSLDKRISMALNHLRETRAARSIDASVVPERFLLMFKKFSEDPAVQDFLSVAAHSHDKAQFGLLEISDSSIYDPLRIFLARRRFRQNLEKVSCESLRPLYGRQIYHCDQYFCHAYRTGFETDADRDRHLRIHQRPNKCPRPDCMFTEIGFRSTSELQSHTLAAHSSGIPIEDESHSSISLAELLEDEYSILKDAVTLDNEELVKVLLSRGVADRRYLFNELIRFAAWKASSDTLSHLLDYNDSYTITPLEQLLAYALEGENLPNIKLLLSRGANMTSSTYIDWKESATKIEQIPEKRAGMHGSYTGYIRALSLWNPDTMAFLINECHVNMPTQIDSLGDIFKYPAILAATPDEARRRFSAIKRYIIWPETYTQGIPSAVLGGNVVSLRICLENGGDPDVYFTGRHYGYNVLCYSVKLGTKLGAEVVKALLEWEADPNKKTQTKPIRSAKEFAGMKKIEKYFGMGWEDIVHKIQVLKEDLAIV
ncbi:uncharacterized protein F4822DRAFT_431452 [Hypoxylon trugodes]|uniref:uncharacterized protein n=1 Tax=Hypoxylon trugodes TaxID=326681 RepID=UPI002199A85F|nr:uncharacterized protein F4822DRAFT_431452 [Hypoxylon trugodes]KAI1386580.1 hypothetical protein F4822DRAFT_431452 [Hypoxylon trugodes]